MNTKVGTILIAAIIIASIIAATTPAGAFSYYSPPAHQNNSSTATGGETTEINFTQTGATSTNWFGFYGNISSGNVTLGGDEHPFFQWSSWDNDTDTAYVFATTNTSAPWWDNFTEVNTTDIDTVWGFNTTYDTDCANETFANDSSSEVNIRNSTYSAGDTARVLTLNGTRLPVWETAVFLNNASDVTTEGDPFYDNFTFVAVNGADSHTNTSYLGSPCDYQLLVPVAGASQTYYLYLELRTSS